MVPEGVDFGVDGVTDGPATRQDRDHTRWTNSPQPGGPVLTTVNVPLKTRDCRAPARAEDCMLVATETVGASVADSVCGANHDPQPTIGNW